MAEYTPMYNIVSMREAIDATIVPRNDLVNTSTSGDNTIIGQSHGCVVFGQKNTASKDGQIIMGGKGFNASGYPAYSYFFPNDKGELMMWIDGNTGITHLKTEAQFMVVKEIQTPTTNHIYDWTITLPIVLTYLLLRTCAWVRKTYENGCKFYKVK